MSDFPYRVALLREEQLKNTLYVSSSKFGPQTSKANQLGRNRDRSRGGDHISARLERTVRLSDQLDITGERNLRWRSNSNQDEIHAMLRTK